MLTGMPSTWMAKSVPWSRLKPRRKNWLALPSPRVLRDDEAGHRLQHLPGPGDRAAVEPGARDRAGARRQGGSDLPAPDPGDAARIARTRDGKTRCAGDAEFGQGHGGWFGAGLAEGAGGHHREAQAGRDSSG